MDGSNRKKVQPRNGAMDVGTFVGTFVGDVDVFVSGGLEEGYLNQTAKFERRHPMAELAQIQERRAWAPIPWPARRPLGGSSPEDRSRSEAVRAPATDSTGSCDCDDSGSCVVVSRDAGDMSTGCGSARSWWRSSRALILTQASLAGRIAAHATGSSIHCDSRMLGAFGLSTGMQRTRSPRP